MDWKYILSLDLDDLNDDDKDELYTAVSWFDCDGEEIDLKKCKALLKVSQEILKYKGEQVETLLHELEEMAVKQGEEEARREESEADAKSIVRSRKSSSIEFENLEQKYMELKAKHKKVIRNNEKNEAQIDKLNKNLTTLQQENRRLQNEIQSMPHEIGSESDMSETIKDQQKELVQTIHNKNKQISDLLRDIEEVENENYLLRDKLSNVRDELSVATKEIMSMTEALREKDVIINDHSEELSKITEDFGKLKSGYNELQKIKDVMKREFDDFKSQANAEIEDLKKLCEEKDSEIKEMKNRLKEPSLNSSISSLPKDDVETSHISALQRALADRERHLLEVQTKLQVATKEMEISTEVIKKSKLDKDRDEAKIRELEATVKDLKKQLKAVHERCQNLQEEVVSAEKTASAKDEELKKVLNKMQENGQVDLVVSIQEIQELKSNNRTMEKQIIGLVKTSNKLQDSCELLERENHVLREKLGIPEETSLSLSGYTSKEKKRKKEMDILKNKLRKLEEQNIELKSDIHKQNQINSSLGNQILNLGHKPDYSSFRVATVYDENLKDENKAIIEENEALRKGMHEILNSINIKKSLSLSEIKSETFEKLLRALDVKHISGWYHPAMRLQAELHNLEGINAELREQLRDTRVELKTYKDIDAMPVQSTTSQPDELPKPIVIEDFLNELLSLENFQAYNVEEFMKTMFSGVKKETESKDVEENQKNLAVLLKNLFNERQDMRSKIDKAENTLKELKQTCDILEEKQKVLDSKTDEEILKKLEDTVRSSVTLKRKVVYMENEAKKYSEKVENLYRDLSTAEALYMKDIGELQRKNKTLESNLMILKKSSDLCVDGDTHKDVLKNLENITVKYRDLALTIKRQQDEKSLEFKMLQNSQQILESDKAELKSKLMEVMSKLSIQDVGNVDDNLERLAQKLAECEVVGITEKQRANHTNNLYELVREQLNKSEERFQEYSKYNEELLKKNLILQDQLKEVEDKIANYVDTNVYKQLQLENNNLLEENNKLQTIISKLEEASRLEHKNFNDQKTWNDQKEQELLNLKHQIVDLISISDEKVIISQLNNDILQCRQSQSYYRTKFKETAEEADILNRKVQQNEARYEEAMSRASNRDSILTKKISNLQSLLYKQKLQYLGCVPLCSEEIYLDNLRIINKEKHDTFLNLHRAKVLENEASFVKEQLELEIEYVKKQQNIVAEGAKEELKNVMNWLQEKKALQINELRYKRQCEFKEKQLQHFTERIKMQDDQILKLDEELLMWQKNLDGINMQKDELSQPSPKLVSKSPGLVINATTISTGIQTDNEVKDVSDEATQMSNLKLELFKMKEELLIKERNIEQLKSKLTELEMTLSMFRKQIGDKQSQISFYERHILELQSKKEEVHTSGAGGDNISVGAEGNNNNEELMALKENLKCKEEDIIKYQTLLKADRDRHSLAAATLQEELRDLQKQLSEEKQKNLRLEESRPNMAAIEQYMAQVHALEKHTSELHTKISSLDAQLQSSRQEAVRWRSLANDRLTAMEQLRESLDEQHKSELMVYKSDSEKLKELSNDEINNLRQLIGKQKIEFSGRIDSDVQKLVTEKDEKIHELTLKLRQHIDVRKNLQMEAEPSIKLSDLESSREMLAKENEILKKRCEQLLGKEKGARDEIRELKAQLLKKPITARSDKSEKSIKDQLQKKISTLESETESLKRALADQISINETHRVQASEDFDKWKKMKHWQQSSEKLKSKLKERENEFEKLQQTNVGYRLLIERLEREKHNLENRIKNLKCNNINVAGNKELDMLKIENMKLLADLEAMHSKLEMQQHHAGALGASMMQEKLENQERKIAILELTSKGTVDVRAELERLQLTVSNLQKSNLRLEAENLDLKLDLEKYNNDVPHLQQQIQHLESYIDVLKNENSKQEVEDKHPQETPSEPKKVSELERTVFILKRVVEKLQTENKRLASGKRPISDRASSADKHKRELVRLKEQYGKCVEKIGQLEQELSVARSKLKNVSIFGKPDDEKMVALSEELSKVKEQLEQKSSLLDKVKVLLHRAAVKEKSLLQEIAELKNQKETGITPIPEESEESSSDL